MRSSKTKGELCPDESEIDILSQQRAGITSWADWITNATCHDRALQQTRICVNLGFDQPVIRWISV